MTLIFDGVTLACSLSFVHSVKFAFSCRIHRDLICVTLYEERYCITFQFPRAARRVDGRPHELGRPSCSFRPILLICEFMYIQTIRKQSRTQRGARAKDNMEGPQRDNMEKLIGKCLDFLADKICFM